MLYKVLDNRMGIKDTLFGDLVFNDRLDQSFCFRIDFRSHSLGIISFTHLFFSSLSQNCRQRLAMKRYFYPLKNN